MTPAAVDGFHAAALAHGGTDNGPQGLRPHFDASYYAAFVIDPDGHGWRSWSSSLGGRALAGLR